MYKVINEESPSINQLNNFDISHVAMKPYFIPDTTSLDDQMRQFLHRRTHFALVVDEYGSLQGLITLEIFWKKSWVKYLMNLTKGHKRY